MSYQMFSTSTFVTISTIVVDREARQRRKLEVSDLVDSIRRNGLYSPIIVERNTLRLIAGERRLEAHRQLGLEEIEVRFRDELSILEGQILELEENLKRKDLEWDDKARSFLRIHQLYLSRNPEQTASATAEALGISPGEMSKQLKVAGELEAKGKVAFGKVASTGQALSAVRRAEHRDAMRSLEELVDVSHRVEDATREDESETAGDETEGEVKPQSKPSEVPPEEVFQGDFISWARDYSGPKFNFLHCDFPYGVNLFDSEYGTRGTDIEYSDSKDVYFALLDAFCEFHENFASMACHYMFWLSNEHIDETKKIFAERLPGISWVRDPLIWVKSDNAGIIRDASRTPRHTYETCLFGQRGNKRLVTAVADGYSGPTARDLHPSAKPTPVLRHFFRLVIDEHTTLLDPTCGSGTALCAADSLGAARVFGIEREAQHVETARRSLSIQRKLKAASEPKT